MEAVRSSETSDCLRSTRRYNTDLNDFKVVRFEGESEPVVSKHKGKHGRLLYDTVHISQFSILTVSYGYKNEIRDVFWFPVKLPLL
jgi:hypothetical protein